MFTTADSATYLLSNFSYWKVLDCYVNLKYSMYGDTYWSATVYFLLC